MGKLDGYKVDLKGMPSDTVSYRWQVSDDFFSAVQGPEIKQGLLDVALRVKQTSDAYKLEFRLKGEVKVTCDRCLKETVQDFSYHEEHTVVRRVESEEEEENYVIAQAESIDAEEIALTDLLLELPSKMLCREDCKGLCSTCGKNLNDGPCGCRKQTDPRFAVLEQLLDKE